MQNRITISLCLLFFPFLKLSLSQTLTNLPQCWQNCISDSGHFNCAALDVSCICRAWNSGILTSVLTCIKSNCDSSLDQNLLLSPLELTCDLAGVPISNSVISSALQAASTTATVTATSTVTQSYYWQSTFGTIATTVVVPITESNGNTVIVAFPVTIEPSTTIYGSPSTSTPLSLQPTATASPNNYAPGCSNPGIIYASSFSDLPQPGFRPANETQFPHGSSPDIATIESFVCNRLTSPCNASPQVQQACSNAFNAYSGLTGQNAADVWNIALGLSPALLNSIITFTSTTWASATSPSTSTWSAESWTSNDSWTSTTTTTTATYGQGSTTTTTTATYGQGLGVPPTSTVTGAAGTTDGGGSPFDSTGGAVGLTRPMELCVLLGLGVLAALALM